MDLVTALVLLGAVVALLLQGGSCLFTERPLSIGFLDLMLAATTSYVAIAMMSGQLVIATELGVLLVQGAWATWLLRLTLVSVAVVPTLCLYRIWRLNAWPIGLRERWGLFVAGIVFGIVAAAQVAVLNPESLEALHVQIYDAWSWPLMVWVTTCFAASVLALVKTTNPFIYVVFAASILTSLSAFVQRWPATADHAAWSWFVIERLSFSVAILGAAWAALDVSGGDRSSRRITQWMAGPAIVGFVFAFAPLPSWLRVAIGALPLAALTLSVAYVILESQAQGVGVLSRGEVAPDSSAAVQSVRHTASQTLKIGRIRAVVLSLAVPIVALCMIDLLAVGLMPRAIDAAVMFVFWILLAERLADNALDRLPGLFKNGILQAPMVARAWTELKKALGAAKTAAGATITFLTGGNGWEVAVKTLLTTISALVFVTVLAEIVTYRPIVVADFQWIGSDDTKAAARAKAISALLINALGRLRRDLRTDLRNASSKRSGSDQEPSALTASAESSVLESTIAKSDDLEIGNIKVPVKFFFGPIQSMVRSLLGVRVIRGSVWKTADDRTVIMVDISDGESWQEVEVPTPGVRAAAAVDGDAQRKTVCPGDASEVPDPTTAVVERLAYAIATTDPSFLAAGLTTNYDAFVQFRRGLRHWNAFEAEGTRAALRRAIGCFREAVDRDRRFSAGHFRLGAALRSDGQPRSAVESFRASTEGNASFIPGALQEAATLYYLAGYAPPVPPVLAPVQDETQSRADARAVWNRIVSLPGDMVSTSDRRAAYFGICNHEFVTAAAANEIDFLVPYFFCSRAAALWPRLTRDARDGQDKDLEADLMTMLGVILEAHHQESRVVPASAIPDGWTCFADQIDEETITQHGEVANFRLYGSPRTRMAKRYYSRNLALAPNNVFARCKLASADAYLAGGHREMQRLSQTVSARLNVANDLVAAAHRESTSVPPKTPPHDPAKQIANATFYYQRALDEYAHAIDLDRSSIDALVGYGYTAWRWAVDAAVRGTAERPGDDLLRTAERHAREAKRIADAWGARADVRWAAAATLGEVVLSQGRPDEAIEYLKDLVNEEWPSVNEVRWDLAQARLCAAGFLADDKGAGLRHDALAGFKEIADNERVRDARPFTLAKHPLDVARPAPICTTSPDSIKVDEARFELRNIQYSSARGCDSVEVGGAVDGELGKDADVRLHVWGGGLDDDVIVQPIGQGAIRPEEPRRNREHYYFARLEDDARRALSSTVSFTIREPKGKNDCSSNAIRLVFAARPAPPKPPKPRTPAALQTAR